MALLYLLDANVLIHANKDYYPLDRMKGFWDWLQSQASDGLIKMPFEIYQEVAVGKDELAVWIKQPQVQDALRLDEEVDREVLQRVLDTGYGPSLTEDELDEAGRDPFLVAHSLMGGGQRTVVTKEVSRPSKWRGHTKVPNACHRLRVPCITDFEMYRQLNFRLQ